jgi:signal transduction histidine kinase/ligand-binding sensor domain-containing protein
MTARQAIRLCSLTLFALVISTRLLALPPSKPLSQLRHTAWTSKDGAPTANSGRRSLAQDAEGYIWLGSSAGLTRFDGSRFTHIDLPAELRDSSAALSDIFAPSSGGIWAGLLYGGAIRYKDGVFTRYGSDSGLPRNTLNIFVEAPDGAIWAVAGSQIFRFDGERWRVTEFASSNGARIAVTRIMFDSEGCLWAAGLDGGLYAKEKDATAVRRITDVTFAVAPATSFAESPTGVLWMTKSGHGVVPVHRSKPTGKTSRAGTGILFDRDGRLWENQRYGIHRVQAPDTTPLFQSVNSSAVADMMDSKSGLSSDSVNDLLEDQEGNIWAFTSAGLDRLSNDSLIHEVGDGGQARFNARLDWSPLIADGTEVWTSHHDDSVPIDGLHETWVRIDGDHVVDEKKAEYSGPGVRTKDGKVLAVVDDALMDLKHTHTPSIPLPPPRLPAPGRWVQSMAEDRAGRLWLSIMRDAVYERVNDGWIPNGGVNALPSEPAIVTSSDAQGRIWLGFTGNRIAVVEDHRATLYASTGLGNILSFYGLRSRIWAGGAFGLAVLDGDHFRTIALPPPIAFGAITGIVETANGDVWLNGSRGIAHISAQELALNFRDPGHVVVADFRDALSGIEGLEQRARPLPTLVETDDGKLWFSTQNNIYSIDPTELRHNEIGPTPVIESVSSDARAYAISDGVVRLPVHTKNLHIDLAGLSWTWPERVKYRYRLDGADDTWQKTSEGQVSYSNLGPGQHVFRLAAANGDGVWSQSDAALTIDIAPAYYQRAWFRGLIVMAAILALLGVFRFRLNQIAHNLKEQHRIRLAERDRIAREIHDTLLQGAEGLILKVHAVVCKLPPDDDSRRVLENSIDRAGELVSEGRDRIIDLRSRSSKRAELSEALRAVAQHMAHEYTMDLKVSFEGSTKTLDEHVWDELYGIAREVIWNAFRHSRGKRVEVNVSYGDKEMRLLVKDDGAGFDLEHLTPAEASRHFGLAGIRERAKHIGATLDIQTSPGQGTCIELRLAAKVAYRDGRAARVSRHTQGKHIRLPS